MHTLKTKRELEIFDQGVQTGRKEMKKLCQDIIFFVEGNRETAGLGEVSNLITNEWDPKTR